MFLNIVIFLKLWQCLALDFGVKIKTFFLKNVIQQTLFEKNYEIMYTSLCPQPDVTGLLTYLQVVPAFKGAGQLMTSNTINCTFIPFPGLCIKRSILIPAFVSNNFQMETIKGQST